MLSIRRKWKLAEGMKETQDARSACNSMERFHRPGPVSGSGVYAEVHYAVTNM